MNHKFALAALVLLTAFAGTAATLHAGTDVHISIGLGTVIRRPLPPPVVVIDRNDRPRGYWKTVTVKEWVPGRWVVERDRRGRPVRTFAPGHYTYRDERVWVGGSERDRDHDGRGYDDRGWNNDYRR